MTPTETPKPTLPFDHPERIAARRVANRERVSRALETLQVGDVIFVDRVTYRGGGYCPAHYAQVMPRTDPTDLGVRGLNGGGCTSGPLPDNTTDWWLVGTATVGITSFRNGQTHLGGGFTDAAAGIARRLGSRPTVAGAPTAA